jgi:hypothetical protein
VLVCGSDFALHVLDVEALLQVQYLCLGCELAPLKHRASSGALRSAHQLRCSVRYGI